MRPPRLIVVLVALLTATLALVGNPAAALAGPYQRGPDPTLASVQAERGPFAVQQITVPANSAPGFNRGTIYYPTDTSQGTFGAVTIIPGFTEPESTMAWYGPRLASQGFVVMTLEPYSVLNIPDNRADQMLAALDYLTTTSQVKNRIDPGRLAVMGHSMGGGGSLRAAQKRPSLKAIIPLAPWHTERDWSAVKTPTLIVAADNDFIAGVGTHAEPFYNSLGQAPEKAYLLLKNAGHMAPIFPNTTIAMYSISWLKRYVDEDTRYSQFLCPPPAPSNTIAQYRDTCPA
ncbi:dienelactone hydrolase family protein [Spirillospora sp. NPDC047279]|uniref:poly(ethylene terephthalate) hydrolase family protein n=1 Tax=Spirillospora sp. NPDC047279 TaxID=3155478 RepID=UPI0033C34C03